MTEEETLGEKIVQVNIENQMKTAYIDYSMSVIVSRALPDVRDGLKPVQRRIIYAMWDMNIVSSQPYKKSARIVGEVLGKYHPHGDIAVYDAMVRMAQPWSLRYPFVDGQGNFGSVDGDSPAAMRYTEARLRKSAEDMVADIEKDTVDMSLNFDDSIPEPTVLPSKIPNLLVNGASGIAVVWLPIWHPIILVRFATASAHTSTTTKSPSLNSCNTSRRRISPQDVSSMAFRVCKTPSIPAAAES